MQGHVNASPRNLSFVEEEITEGKLERKKRETLKLVSNVKAAFDGYLTLKAKYEDTTKKDPKWVRGKWRDLSSTAAATSSRPRRRHCEPHPNTRRALALGQRAASLPGDEAILARAGANITATTSTDD